MRVRHAPPPTVRPAATPVTSAAPAPAKAAVDDAFAPSDPARPPPSPPAPRGQPKAGTFDMVGIRAAQAGRVADPALVKQLLADLDAAVGHGARALGLFDAAASITSLADRLARDGRLDGGDVYWLVTEAKDFGRVTDAERRALEAALDSHGERFTPEARAGLAQFLGREPRADGPPPLDGSGRVASSGVLPGRSVRDAYFDKLDHDPAFHAQRQEDAFGALLDLVTRADIPPEVDAFYARKAGSLGGGRLLMALDYTRGMPSAETPLQSLKGGLIHYAAVQHLGPMLGHFREVKGEQLFRGDSTFAAPFKDSTFYGPQTNQVGHFSCALDTGVRAGYYDERPVQKWFYERGLALARSLFGMKGVDPSIADFSRAGMIGHEMEGDDDASGFTAQIGLYGKLVDNGDPAAVRSHFDAAVAAAVRGDHALAFQHIRAIAAAAEIPLSADDVKSLAQASSPRFAPAGKSRTGNSLPDLALSIYGFATGHLAATGKLATPEALREHLASVYGEDGALARALA